MFVFNRVQISIGSTAREGEGAKQGGERVGRDRHVSLKERREKQAKTNTEGQETQSGERDTPILSCHSSIILSILSLSYPYP